MIINPATTLAHKLGRTTHFSVLLLKAQRLGLREPRALEALAIARGCDYYRHAQPLPAPAVEREKFSDEELAIVLLHLNQLYDPQLIRLGAAMLSAPGNDPRRVAELAQAERSEAVVRYVAEAGRRFEPENAFWPELLAALSSTLPLPDGVLPHPTRFVAMTGITRRGVGLVVRWIRPPVAEIATHG